jgi:hypothetical protein
MHGVDAMVAFNKTWLMIIALCASTLHADLRVHLQIARRMADDSYTMLLQPKSKDRSLFPRAKKEIPLPKNLFTETLMPKGASFVFDSKKVVPDKTGGTSYNESYNKMITNLTKEQCAALAAARELSMVTRVTQLLKKPSPEAIKQSLIEALSTFSAKSRSLFITPLSQAPNRRQLSPSPSFSMSEQEESEESAQNPSEQGRADITIPVDISVNIEETSIYKPMIEPAYVLVKDFVQALGISMPPVNEEPWHKRHRGKLVAGAAVGGSMAATALTLYYLSRPGTTPSASTTTATPASPSSISFSQGIASAAGSAMNNVKKSIGDWLGGHIAKHVVERASANYQANSPEPGLLQKAQEAAIGAGVQKAFRSGVSKSFRNWTP